jgi:guanylate kinase
MQRGELFILSAPSGTGKTTIIQHLMAGPMGSRGGVVFSVSHTTRSPRAGEREGLDYFFVDRPTFEEMAATGRFLEWAQVHDNLYGTSHGAVAPRLEEGLDVVLDIDVQGAEQVLERFPGATGILILPPGFRTLRQRLEGRSLDDPRAVSARLSVSLGEIARYGKYHYVIINHDAKQASEALASIILARRHRLERMRAQVEAVLEDFRSAFGEQTTDPLERAPAE